MAINQQWWQGNDSFPLKDLEIVDTVQHILQVSQIPDVCLIFRERLAKVLPENVTVDYVMGLNAALAFIPEKIRSPVIETLESIRVDFQGKRIRDEVPAVSVQSAGSLEMKETANTSGRETVSEEVLQQSLGVILGERYTQEDVTQAILASLQMSAEEISADERLEEGVVIAIIKAYWSVPLSVFEREAPKVFSHLRTFLWNRNLLRTPPPSGSFVRPSLKPSETVDTPARPLRTGIPRVDTVRDGALTADMVRAAAEADRVKKESDRLKLEAESNAQISQLDVAVETMRKSLSGKVTLNSLGIDESVVPNFDE